MQRRRSYARFRAPHVHVVQAPRTWLEHNACGRLPVPPWLRCSGSGCCMPQHAETTCTQLGPHADSLVIFVVLGVAETPLLCTACSRGSGPPPSPPACLDKARNGKGVKVCQVAHLAGAVKGAGHADDAVQAGHADYGASVGLDAAGDAVHCADRNERARVVLWVAHCGNHLFDILCVAASAVSRWLCKRMRLRVAVAQSTNLTQLSRRAHSEHLGQHRGWTCWCLLYTRKPKARQQHP